MSETVERSPGWEGCRDIKLEILCEPRELPQQWLQDADLAYRRLDDGTVDVVKNRHGRVGIYTAEEFDEVLESWPT